MYLFVCVWGEYCVDEIAGDGSLISKDMSRMIKSIKGINI